MVLKEGFFKCYYCVKCKDSHTISYDPSGRWGYYKCSGVEYLGVIDRQMLPRNISEKIRKEKDEAASNYKPRS